MNIDWRRKLTSRKLWLAVGAFVSGLIMAFGGSESVAQMVSGVILQGAAVLGYLLAEGLTDASNGSIDPDVQGAIQKGRGTSVMVSKSTSVWDSAAQESEDSGDSQDVSRR